MRSFLALIRAGVAGLALTSFAASSWALGFGANELASSLGQPLDFKVVVTAAADEVITPECVHARVVAGDNPLGSDAIAIRMDPKGSDTLVRVRSKVRIVEPVVTVTLNVGCPTRLTRQFVSFVDPAPLVTPQVAMPSIEEQATPQAPSTRRFASTSKARGESSSSSVAQAPSGKSRATTKSDKSAAAQASSRRGGVVGRGMAGASAAGGSVPRVAAASGTQATSSSSRLVLEDAAEAASAASARSLAAAQAEQRVIELKAALETLASERAKMKMLEDTLAEVRRENQQTRKTLAAMQARLQEAQIAASGPSVLIVSLALIVALLTAALMLLVWQLVKARRASPAWHESVSADAAAVKADMTPDPEPEHSEPSVFNTTPQPNIPVETATPEGGKRPEPVVSNETQPAAFNSHDTASTVPRHGSVPTFNYKEGPSTVIDEPKVAERELSVEELMDLEQQADFFIVLGQDEAAIDLLMGMIRSSGGSTPMPYLKLLEIYRRNGDKASYARIRERFNQRFNGVAPPWDADAAPGRDIEAYGDTLARLQEVWDEPEHTTAILDRLLFQRAPGHDPFELDAFADLLFLHRISRDLCDVKFEATGVDLLLPLDVMPDAQPTTMPAPISLQLERPFGADGRIDLDLGEPVADKEHH